MILLNYKFASSRAVSLFRDNLPKYLLNFTCVYVTHLFLNYIGLILVFLGIPL